MDKTIILAVAGSGKTSLIIDNLDLKKKVLILTYTINNTRNLKGCIIKKFGYFPNNIELYSYYPFLYSFCLKPFLAYKFKPKGIHWDFPPSWTYTKSRKDKLFYFTQGGRIYHNRIAKLFEEFDVLDNINFRLEKYYDALYIDEVQDFAGHDFNFLKSVIKANLEIKLVGDFYQHTFDTSRDGKINNDLHDSYENYKKKFEDIGIKVDTHSLNKSWRCTPEICDFITKKIGVEIYSHKNDISEVKVIFDQEEARSILENKNIIKLFYKESYKYNCFSKNWGDCKGENIFQDVCVILNKNTLKHFKEENLYELAPSTKNKLYVACSRAHKNLFLIPENLVAEYKSVRV